MNGYNLSGNISRVISLNNEKGRSLRFTAGYEILSGTHGINGTGTEPERLNRSYSPLFGTNHLHNGYLDFFYVGGRHENPAGLRDVFIWTRSDANPNLFFSLNGHSFRTDASVYSANQRLSGNLGYEAYLTMGYILNEAVSIQGGYSQIFASETLMRLQNIQKPAPVQNWGCVLMIYWPTMKNRFVGLQFYMPFDASVMTPFPSRP